MFRLSSKDAAMMALGASTGYLVSGTLTGAVGGAMTAYSPIFDPYADNRVISVFFRVMNSCAAAGLTENMSLRDLSVIIGLNHIAKIAKAYAPRIGVPMMPVCQGSLAGIYLLQGMYLEGVLSMACILATFFEPSEVIKCSERKEDTDRSQSGLREVVHLGYAIGAASSPAEIRDLKLKQFRIWIERVDTEMRQRIFKTLLSVHWKYASKEAPREKLAEELQSFQGSLHPDGFPEVLYEIPFELLESLQDISDRKQVFSIIEKLVLWRKDGLPIDPNDWLKIHDRFNWLRNSGTETKADFKVDSDLVREAKARELEKWYPEVSKQERKVVLERRINGEKYDQYYTINIELLDHISRPIPRLLFDMEPDLLISLRDETGSLKEIVDSALLPLQRKDAKKYFEYQTNDEKRESDWYFANQISLLRDPTSF